MINPILDDPTNSPSDLERTFAEWRESMDPDILALHLLVGKDSDLFVGNTEAIRQRIKSTLRVHRDVSKHIDCKRMRRLIQERYTADSPSQPKSMVGTWPDPELQEQTVVVHRDGLVWYHGPDFTPINGPWKNQNLASPEVYLHYKTYSHSLGEYLYELLNYPLRVQTNPDSHQATLDPAAYLTFLLTYETNPLVLAKGLTNIVQRQIETDRENYTVLNGVLRILDKTKEQNPCYVDDDMVNLCMDHLHSKRIETPKTATPSVLEQQSFLDNNVMDRLHHAFG